MGDMLDRELYGGIEAGGTKFVCALASQPPHLDYEVTFQTSDPVETLSRVQAFFQPFIDEGRVKSIGNAAFGPVDVDPSSLTYGYITATPKLAWVNTNILGKLHQSLGVPLAFHADVSGSAIGEYTWGAARGIDPSLYLTIGTGIGGSFLLHGEPHVGMTALETGHIRIPHNLSIDPFEGACPYHKDCFEGLAAGPALAARFGARGELLADEDPFWQIEAEYIAYALVNYILILSPRIIVLGGGIMQRSFLFDIIRRRVREMLNGYIQAEKILTDIERYIVPPALGRYSGVLGAIAMAQRLD